MNMQRSALSACVIWLFTAASPLYGQNANISAKNEELNRVDVLLDSQTKARLKIIEQLPSNEKSEIKNQIVDAFEQHPRLDATSAMELETSRPVDTSSRTKAAFDINVTTQQVVIDQLKPVVISKDKAVVQEQKTFQDLHDILLSHADAYLQSAHSVGRLTYETSSNGHVYTGLLGTAFVVGKDVVATACHTLGNVGKLNSGQFTIAGGLKLWIDFDDSSTLKPEFPVQEVLGFGSFRGYDFALLRIKLEHGAELPPTLSLSKQFARPKYILVLGYPDLSDLVPCSDQTLPRCKTDSYFAAQKEQFPSLAKIGSPGATLDLPSLGKPQRFTYDAPTRKGQSGSPVLDAVTLEVVGIHYCCGGAEESSHLECSDYKPISLSNNEAISSVELLDDPTLKKFLQP